MTEILCSRCLEEGKISCEFRRKAEAIASRVPASSTLEEVVKAHNQIEGERVVAREKLCPQRDLINPDYPGRNQAYPSDDFDPEIL